MSSMEENNHFYYDLPEDLIIEILLMLPVKSLLRFKSVCKHWFALIETPNFIYKHFRHQSNNTNLLIYWAGSMLSHDPNKINDVLYPHSFTLFTNHETLEKREELDHLTFPACVSRIYGPCKGIFCVHIKNKKLVLWNPATGRMRPIPTPPKCFSNKIDDFEFGFGVDPLTDEFKIVLIPSGYDGVKILHPCFAVYRSGNDSWRFFEKEALLDWEDAYIPRNCSINTFLNGFYYWLRFDCITEIMTSYILAFDMHMEIFEEIETPMNISLSHNGMDLVLYNKSLAILSYCCDPDNDIDRDIDIWVMKEKGCWTKLLNVVPPFKILWTRGFWTNGMIFISDHDRELFLYDLDSNDSKNLGLAKRGATSYEVFLFHYKESLFPVKGINGILHDYSTHSDAFQLLFLT